MSEQDEQQLREELRSAVNERDYSVAVGKAEEMAIHFEDIGKQDKARESWLQAAKLYINWSENQKEGRTFKNSAKSLAHAADIYANLGMDKEAAQIISNAAHDLVAAGDEYIVWKQPMGASVCYASAAILFILVSQEGIAQQVINQVKSRIDALRQDSKAVALIDLPNQLKYAKNQLDIRLLNNVKTMINSSLIPALTNTGLSEFVSYIERTVHGVENYINSEQKYPVLEYDIKMEGEVIIDEPFDIQIMVTNTGEETAYDVELEMVPKEEVTIVREFSKLKEKELAPNSAVALTWRCIVKSENVLEETQEINLSARLSFSDGKGLKQTLAISPLAFKTISPQQTDQIKMEIDVIDSRVEKIKKRIIEKAEEHGKQIVSEIFDVLDKLVDQADGFIEAGAIQNAKSWSSLLQLELDLIEQIVEKLPSKESIEKTDEEE
ncbi:MAG: hypothetical protein U9O98_07325 [Asgard group archaeon]|nr:hypothetical protein [Asgard group archaeon]